MNTTDWSKYLVTEKEDLGQNFNQEIEEEQPNQAKINWDQYLSKEDKWKVPEPVRHTTRGAARILESIAGLPGDVVQFVKSINEFLPKLPKFLSGEDRQNFIQKKGREALEKLPTSEDLKKFSSDITSGFTDPLDTAEKFGDDIVSLGTTMLIGSKDPLKFKNLMKALGTSIFAKGVGKGAELYGATEKGQTAAEIGSLALTSLLSRRYADAFVKNKYQKARAAIPPDTMLGTESLKSDLGKVKKELGKGLPKTSATKSEVIRTIEELENKIAGGSAPAEDILQSYHDINEKLTSKKLFEELSTTEKKLLKSRYDNVKREIDKSLANYGEQNPEFYKEWKEANAAHAILAQSKSTKDFIMRNLKTIPGHLMASAALKMFLGLPSLAAAGGGFAAFQTGKVLGRIAKNPSLRKYYIDVLNSASAENLPQMIRNLNNLNKQLEKDQSSGM